MCKSLCTIGKHTRELCHFTSSAGTWFHFRWVCRFGLSISGAGRQLRTRFPGARTDRLPSLSQFAWSAILLLQPISEHQESLETGKAMIFMLLGELILFTKSTNHHLWSFQGFGSYLEYCSLQSLKSWGIPSFLSGQVVERCFYPQDIANKVSQERNDSQALLWRRLYECFLLKSLWRQAWAQEIMGSLNSTNNEPFLPWLPVLAWISGVPCHLVLPEHHLKCWIPSNELFGDSPFQRWGRKLETLLEKFFSLALYSAA